LLLRDFLQKHELVNAGVIDQDIDLSECFLCFREQFLNFCLLRYAALDSDSFSGALDNFIYHAICVLLCRDVINDYGRARLRKLFCNPRADSLRCSCYYCNFSNWFIAFHFGPLFI